jgi:hypothetical protein
MSCRRKEWTGVWCHVEMWTQGWQSCQAPGGLEDIWPKLGGDGLVEWCLEQAGRGALACACPVI